MTDIDAGTNLVKFSYDYVANSNNIATITFDHRPDTPYNAFDYDHLDRLTEAEYLVGVLTEGEVFGMDDLGNRTTVNLRSGADQVYATDTPNITNRYTAVGGQPLAYDAAGNLTQDHDGYRYVYDYENRTTRIFKLDGQTEIDVAQYTYDALGRRIEARSFADGQLDAVRRYWYNDQWQALTQELWLSEQPYSVRRNYIYGNYIDEVLVMNDGAGDLYYAHDHLYSPVALLNDTGAVVDRYEYDAYGRRSVMTPGFAHRNNSHYLSDIGLTGREIDELDLDATATPRLHHMHYRHRDYSPQLGRFLQHDPLGVNPHPSVGNYFLIDLLHYFDGLSLFEYVSSKPMTQFDPFGLYSTLNPCSLAAAGFTPKEIAAMLGISLAAAHAIINGQCDPIPLPISRPAPKCPPRDTGDCTPDEHAALQSAVDSACHGSASRSCKGTDHVAVLSAKLAQNTACAIARDHINGKCYKGGDKGHRTAAGEAWNAVSKCAGMIWDSVRRRVK